MIPELGRSRLAQPAEVSNKLLVVLLRVDIEVIPQVTPDGHTAEPIFAHLLNVFKRHTTLGHHMAVYDALPCSSQQFVGGKRGFVLTFRDAVEDVAKQNILALRFMLLKALQVITSASDRSLVRNRSLRMALAEMNAHQIKLIT